MKSQLDAIYILVIVLLGLGVLIIFGRLLLEVYNERRKSERWLALQPPEVIISGRKKAIEKARALLQGEIENWQLLFFQPNPTYQIFLTPLPFS